MYCRRLTYKICILEIALIFLLITGCNTVPNLPASPTSIPIPTSTPIPTSIPIPTSTPIPTSVPIPTLTPSPKVRATEPRLVEGKFPTQTVVTEENSLTIQPNFLADPQAACFIYHINWHSSTSTLLSYDDYALSCLDMNGWHIYGPDTFEDPLAIPKWIAQCPDGRIYLEMFNNGFKFYIFKGETLVEIKDLDQSVDSLACGPGSEIWVAYYRGVNHFTGSTWIHYPATEYLGSGELVDLVKSIAVAPNGSVWVATASSIATFDGADWQIFEAGKGFEENPHPRSLDIDSNGNVWVVNNRGLLKYDGIQWSTYYDGVPNRFEYYPEFIGIDEENRIWVANTYPASIYMYDPQTNSWMLQIGEEALNVNLIKAMQFDRQGRLWLATDYGLFVYDGSVLTAYHMHTADLYANTADAMIILGDGPQLPALALKAPGSVHGKLVNLDPTSYTNMQVEICLEDVRVVFSSVTPCANQGYHALTTVEADGKFMFTDIPVGKYYLMIQVSSTSWSNMGEFEVKPGTVTEFGEIEFPPN